MSNIVLSKVGSWKVVVRNPGSETAFTQHRVTSRARTDDTYPIKLATYISHQHLDYDGENVTTTAVSSVVILLIVRRHNLDDGAVETELSEHVLRQLY